MQESTWEVAKEAKVVKEVVTSSTCSSTLASTWEMAKEIRVPRAVKDRVEEAQEDTSST